MARQPKNSKKPRRRFSEEFKSEALALADKVGVVTPDHPSLGAVIGIVECTVFADDTVTMIDWQTVLRGPAAMDLTSFCATSLTVEQRRAGEADLRTGPTLRLLNIGYGNLVAAAASAVVVE